MRAGREIVLVLVFALAAVVITWPLAATLDTALADLGDPLLNVWILDWDLYSATHGFHHLFQAPIFHPAQWPLAYSENLFGIAIFALPLYLAHCLPIVIYNVCLLLGFALSGVAASLLVRQVTPSFAARATIGLLYAFTPFRFEHLSHLQLIWGVGPPLVLAALIAYLREPRPRHAALLGAAFLFNGLTNVYFLLFVSVAIVVTAALVAIAQPERPRRFWSDAAIALGAASVLLLPILWPYEVVSRLYHMTHDWWDVLAGSATWSSWLAPALRNRVWGAIADPERSLPERSLFPGLLLPALTIAAIGWRGADSPARAPEKRTRTFLLDVAIVLAAILTLIAAMTDKHIFTIGGVRLFSIEHVDIPAMLLTILLLVRFAPKLRRGLAASRFPLSFWIAAAWIVLGVVASLGLHVFVHEFLYLRVQPFRAIRAPARWAVLAQTGLVVTAAYGWNTLVRGRRLVALLLLAAALVDVWPRLRWEHALPPEPVYAWLRDHAEAVPAVELPMSPPGVSFFYDYGATVHHRPIFNGTSGFEPPLHRELRELTQQERIDDRFTDLLLRNGCRTVIVHEDWLIRQGPRVREWLSRELGRGRLQFLTRLDHRFAGDWLFALPANFPNAPRNVDQSELQRMLDNKPTPMQQTFGRVEIPLQMAEVRGPLTVRGWALSPAGIRSIAVIVHGTQRFPARLFDRGDVTAAYPWYPRVPQPGFVATIASPPRGVPEDTDVQVEITDGSGRRTRLQDVLIAWR